MVFFETGKNEFLPIADIEVIHGSYRERSGGQKHSAVVAMRDGRQVQVEDDVLDNILRMTHPIIPALPGFVLLTHSHHDGESYVSEDTILAWRSGQYRGLEPVVIDTEFRELTAEHGILEPSGRVQAFDRSFGNRADWEAEMEAMVLAEIARKKTSAVAKNPLQPD